jgi:hypothetical protein
MRLLIVVVFLSLGICSNVNAAGACSCKGQPQLEEALARSSVVFIGRVESQKDSSLRPGYRQIRIAVLRKFKWLDDLTKLEYVVLFTPKESALCGFSFQNGFDYLVFAHGNPAFLKTDSCSRTEVLDKALLDQQKLIRLTEDRR